MYDIVRMMVNAEWAPNVDPPTAAQFNTLARRVLTRLGAAPWLIDGVDAWYAANPRPAPATHHPAYPPARQNRKERFAWQLVCADRYKDRHIQIERQFLRQIDFRFTARSLVGLDTQQRPLDPAPLASPPPPDPRHECAAPAIVVNDDATSQACKRPRKVPERVRLFLFEFI